jgi:hypothetical protein
MSFIQKAFAPKEVKAALGALDEAAYKYQNRAFQLIRPLIEQMLLTKPDEFILAIKESGGRTPREWVFAQIGNIAGDLLESGQYHIYRGVLNPMGPGKDLLTMFDETHDDLVQMKAIDPEYADKQKQVLRRNLEKMG